MLNVHTNLTNIHLPESYCIAQQSNNVSMEYYELNCFLSSMPILPYCPFEDEYFLNDKSERPQLLQFPSYLHIKPSIAVGQK